MGEQATFCELRLQSSKLELSTISAKRLSKMAQTGYAWRHDDRNHPSSQQHSATCQATLKRPEEPAGDPDEPLHVAD